MIREENALHRIVVPTRFHSRVMTLLHEEHPGINRMKALARFFLYWTNITKDIENFFRECRSCQEATKSPVKTELH
ncbi:hypothetical protein ANCDUO_11982 [Ancylostoma duodenale]|uniref:RNA-directed DNA polymerase n=1 Tax=Ancylostoma duodenale TaxID=51022 RepID=A0A0C2GA31_9BILA|nr:hypothetical protein ANCDUO_11982 [Ancylostoma duodenale]